jgi:hypothetical protein
MRIVSRDRLTGFGGVLPNDVSSSGPWSSSAGRITFGGSILAIGDSAGSRLALPSTQGDSTESRPALVSTEGDARALRRAIARHDEQD